MSDFKGKAIYNPSGKAGEYARWACNFYVGCSNGCTYCYCKKGILNGVMGMDTPQLKKCFKDEDDALDVFEKELYANKDDLQEHGLFFSFTTDPMLYSTRSLTFRAVDLCQENSIPVKILTKKSNIIDLFVDWYGNREGTSTIAVGFTLTGHDELEPKASTNDSRIWWMKKLKDAGFRTFASIEPIIDFESSLEMIKNSLEFCDLYNIGLMAGKKYDKDDLKAFIDQTIHEVGSFDSKIYFKDSLLKQAGIERSKLPPNCVDRDFNMLKK